MLNKKSGTVLFAAVLQEADFHDLNNAAIPLSGKQVIMLDEHHQNEKLANTLRNANHSYFSYEVWDTDHSFTNKRVSLIKRVPGFLDK